MKRIALVTGASSELGKKISEKLINGGYYVYAGVLDLKEDVVNSKHIGVVILDVTNNGLIKGVFNKIMKEQGKLDLLVNVAGITINGLTIDIKEEDFKQMLDVNVLGTFRMIKHFFPLLKKINNSKIINITSMTGMASFPNAVCYSASKHALEALGQGVRSELLKHHIWTTNIAPGAIDSGKKVSLNYKPMREKYKLIKYLFPMVTYDKVASAVIDVDNFDEPPMHVLLGNDTKVVYLIKKLLPDFLWDRVLRYLWR